MERRKNGDGMNIAFVEDAQHDVDSYQRGQDQNWLIDSERKKAAAVPWKVGLNAGRHSDLVLGGLNALTASPTTRGSGLNDRVTTGNWPW